MYYIGGRSYWNGSGGCWSLRRLKFIRVKGGRCGEVEELFGGILVDIHGVGDRGLWICF